MKSILDKFKFNNFLIYIILGVLILSSIILVLGESPLYSLIPFFLLIFILFFINKLNVGIYIIAFLFAFSGIELSFGSTNAAIVDFFALFILIIYCFRTLIDLLSQKIKLKDLKLPLIKVFGLFVIVSLLASFNATYVYSSWKYLARMIMFSYIAFVLLPVNILKNKEELNITIKSIFYVTLTAVFLYVATILIYSFGNSTIGLSSMVSLFDNYIFGYNHNLLGEVYLIGFFAGIYLFFNAKSDFYKLLYIISLIGIALANIFVMSRASFLAMIFGIVILFVIWPFIKDNKAEKKVIIFNLAIRCVVAAIMAVVLFLFFMSFLQNIQRYDIAGSNSARMDMSRIAINGFLKHPIFGSGPGTFINLTETDSWFMKAYGGVPLDSHGIAQKILVEQGIIGVIVFGCIVFALIKEYYLFMRNTDSVEDRISVSVLFVLVASCFFIELFNTTYYSCKLWLPIGIYIAGLNIYRKNYDFKW